MATLTPVDYNPFETKKEAESPRVKMTPVEGNPFAKAVDSQAYARGIAEEVGPGIPEGPYEPSKSKFIPALQRGIVSTGKALEGLGSGPSQEKILDKLHRAKLSGNEKRVKIFEHTLRQKKKEEASSEKFNKNLEDYYGALGAYDPEAQPEGFIENVIYGLVEFAPEMITTYPLSGGSMASSLTKKGIGHIAKKFGLDAVKTVNNKLLREGGKFLGRTAERGIGGGVGGATYGATTGQDPIESAKGFAMAEMGFGAAGDVGRGVFRALLRGPKKPTLVAPEKPKVTLEEPKPKEKRPWEKSDLAESPNIAVGSTKAEKQANGKWKLFFRGTRNEVFVGERFNSAAEAKQFFEVQKAYGFKSRSERMKPQESSKEAISIPSEKNLITGKPTSPMEVFPTPESAEKFMLKEGEIKPAEVKPIETKPELPEVKALIIQEAKTLKSAVIKPIKDFWAQPPEQTDVKRIVGKYQGDIQRYNWKLSKLGKSINKEFPKVDQQAMGRWMQAGGDKKVLQEWKDNTTDPALKKIYDKALNLKGNSLEMAKQGAVDFHEGGQEAIKHGILEDVVDFYFPKINAWENPTKGQSTFIAKINAGSLQTKPQFSFQRAFDSFFKGEQEGFKIKGDADTFGKQYVGWFSAFAEAKAAREALKQMMKAKMPDGRPMVYVGGMVGESVKVGQDSPYFVKPNAKSTEVYDYKNFDHPALRKWKWAGKDEVGKDIMLQGNMIIHPKAVPEINSLLGKSKIKTYQIPSKFPFIGGKRPGAALLKAGAFIKGTVLIGPFHQAHVGEHAVFHGVNPLNPPKLDLEGKIEVELVDHGAMVYNHNGLMDFGEGVHSGGLLHLIGAEIKKAGKNKLSEKNPLRKLVTDKAEFLRTYGEFLFQDYIPRLKMAMMKAAVGRAEKWYAKDLESGKLTRDQLLDNVAKQGNAAFGELNYKYMGRNPTYQDLLRITLLAPDFLEARLKFAGQALRPYGREQQKAFIKGAVMMTLIAQSLNVLVGDDHEVNLKKPFAFKVGDREYQPRSVMGDIWHLVSDPRSFWYHRLNPLTSGPTLRLVSGKNQYGQKEAVPDAVKDIVESWIPIPAQGLVRGNLGDTKTAATINSIMKSVGVSNYPSKTSAERKILEIRAEHRSVGKLSKRLRDKYDFKYDMIDEYKAGDITIVEIRKRAKKEGVILNALDMQDIRFSTKEGEVVERREFRRKTQQFSADEIMTVWKEMDDEEKAKFGNIVRAKVARSQSITIQDKREFMSQLKRGQNERKSKLPFSGKRPFKPGKAQAR